MSEIDYSPKFAPFFGMVSNGARTGQEHVLIAAAGWHLLRNDIRMYVPSPYLNRTLLISRIGIGAAYGTAKSGIGIAGVGTFRPDLIMKAC